MLWVKGKPFTSTGFEYVKILDKTMNTNDKETEIIKGVIYKISVTELSKKHFFTSGNYKVTTTVIISNDCEKAKIWLLKTDFSKLTTLFRAGLWKQHHKKMFEQSGLRVFQIKI